MTEDEELKKLSKKLYDSLSAKGKINVEEFSEQFDVSKHKVWEAASYLEKKRNDITLVGNKKDDVIYMTIAGIEAPDHIPISKTVSTYKIGVVSDTRLGSKYQSLTPLYAAYELFKHNDVDFVIHAGHVFAGKEDKSRLGEMFIKDPDDQLDYAAAIYPKMEGVRTYMLSANRDRSFSDKKKGFRDLVRELTEKREDLVYVAQDWKFPITDTDTMIRVMHPVDEAAPRGKSYGLQTTMEEIGNFMKTVNYEDIMKTEGVDNTILVLGGYHVPLHIPDHSGLTAGFSVPSLYAQSPFLRKRKISPTIGAYIIELNFDAERKLKNGGIKATFFPLDRFIRKYDYFEEPRKEVGLDDIDTKVLDNLRMELSMSYGELSRRLGVSKKKVMGSVEKLKKLYNTEEKTTIVSPEDNVADTISEKKVVYYPKYAEKFGPPEIDFADMFKDKIKVISVSDSHIGRKDDDDSIEVLKEAYRIAEKEKVDFVINSGDVSDGPGCVGYRNHKNDTKFAGADELVDYLVSEYPKAKGIKTKTINGNHDDWVFESVGHDLVKAFSERRDDIDYLGRLYAAFKHKDTKFTLIHGAGGTGYTLSYMLQKLLRYVLEYERDTDVLEVGNYHKALFMYHGGVYSYLNPATISPGDFQKVRGIPEFVGFWLKELSLNAKGKITSVTNTYFDKKKANR